MISAHRLVTGRVAAFLSSPTRIDLSGQMRETMLQRRADEEITGEQAAEDRHG
ncbi:hypothetical protein ABT150_14405 [Streptomyces mirabilis]|uniref:hypothetical protein n=1 Tax=Streptomyces mirabilis TaxID=68239 RepID=UPI00332BC45B